MKSTDFQNQINFLIPKNARCEARPARSSQLAFLFRTAGWDQSITQLSCLVFSFVGVGIPWGVLFKVCSSRVALLQWEGAIRLLFRTARGLLTGRRNAGVIVLVDFNRNPNQKSDFSNLKLKIRFTRTT